MGIEILIQDFRSLLVEVSSLPPWHEEREGKRKERKGKGISARDPETEM